MEYTTGIYKVLPMTQGGHTFVLLQLKRGWGVQGD